MPSASAMPSARRECQAREDTVRGERGEVRKGGSAGVAQKSPHLGWCFEAQLLGPALQKSPESHPILSVFWKCIYLAHAGVAQKSVGQSQGIQMLSR